MEPTHPAMIETAWQAYYGERATESSTGRPLGWNPRRIFEAGYLAALNDQSTIEDVRASGWASTTKKGN